ncbi:MAG: hypothetical protein QOI92_162 [Chloroflexota bacterium]|jgi:hypothetical protein|nr:hypothetical protein [Chloroflexota bacterium]
MLASPATTLASCVRPPDVKTAVASADIVFIGTVMATATENSPARVAVEEVWRGPDQPAEVLMRVGSVGDTATSVDRTVEVGVKYLFVPYLDVNGVLNDNACSSTTPWTADLMGLRPAGARLPIGGPAAAAGFDFGILGPLIVAVVVAGALLAVGLLARGRQPG